MEDFCDIKQTDDVAFFITDGLMYSVGRCVFSMSDDHIPDV